MYNKLYNKYCAKELKFWLVGLFYSISTLSGHLLPNQVILIKVSNNSVEHKYTVKFKNSLFKTIQLSVITLFSYIWPIDRTLPSATSMSQSGPGSNGIEGTLCIPQASPSDCLVSYPGHSFGESMYSAVPADWAMLNSNFHCK